MTNREAVDRTIETLTDLGRVESLDAGILELCRTAASALDEYPTRATLVKEYRECLMLLALVGANDDGDAFEELLHDLRATMGDQTQT